MSGAIPDPADPEGHAIDSESGELMPPVFLIPHVANPDAPSLAELKAGTHIGWAQLDERCTDCEWVEVKELCDPAPRLVLGASCPKHRGS